MKNLYIQTLSVVHVGRKVLMNVIADPADSTRIIPSFYGRRLDIHRDLVSDLEAWVDREAANMLHTGEQSIKANLDIDVKLLGDPIRVHGFLYDDVIRLGGTLGIVIQEYRATIPESVNTSAPFTIKHSSGPVSTFVWAEQATAASFIKEHLGPNICSMLKEKGLSILN